MNIHQIFDQSYVPYSNQPEAAVVQSKDNRFFPGKRIENVCYPLSITAVQTALFCCLSEGGIPHKLMATHTEDKLLPFWEKEFDLSISTLNIKKSNNFQFADITISHRTKPEEMLPDLLDYAHVEQSDFPVAALLKTEEGYISGVNIECSSWSMGLCAERVAIAKALTYNQTKLQNLHIHTRSGKFSSPCGACRQVISEHLLDQHVHLHHPNKSRSVHFSNDLLPFSFHSSSLSNS